MGWYRSVNRCIPVPDDLTNAKLEVTDWRRARKLGVLMAAPYPTTMFRGVGNERVQLCSNIIPRAQPPGEYQEMARVGEGTKTTAPATAGGFGVCVCQW